MVGTAVHIWWNGKVIRENLELADYNRGFYVTSTLLGWTNTMNHIRRLTASDKVYTDKVWKNNCPLFLQSEQKRLADVKTLVDIYSKPVELVFDQFADYLSTARALVFMR